MTRSRPRVLLSGPTGYIGGRLLSRLSGAGVILRCLTRNRSALVDRVPDGVEVVEGDLTKPETLDAPLADIDTAYYLVHAMASGAGFEERDRRSAQSFASAAKRAGVRRIIYLGGLGDESGHLSPHLRSRHEVGRILRESGIQTIELRASIVIGSGSLSFEMIRALVERLPVMTTPRWVSITAQPIGIEDLLAYLMEALDAEWTESAVVEIGGADRVTYRDLMREYARQRGLRRIMLPVPILSPRISSLWLGLVTPLFARIGRILIESIPNATVVRDPSGGARFRVRPMGVREAIAAALRNEDRDFAETRWSDSLSLVSKRSWGGTRLGNRIVDHRTVLVAADPATAFDPIRRIGGKTGWYYGNWLWQIRGVLDLLMGGVGMRRGRRDPQTVRTGDVIDCWRVESFEPDRRLRLSAEMRMPGRAWLEFEVRPEGNSSRISQTAIFDPAGLCGLAYWYALYGVHHLVFTGMLSRIAAKSTP